MVWVTQKLGLPVPPLEPQMVWRLPEDMRTLYKSQADEDDGIEEDDGDNGGWDIYC